MYYAKHRFPVSGVDQLSMYPPNYLLASFIALCHVILSDNFKIAYAGAKRRRDRLNPTPWPENTDTPAAKSDNLFI